VDEAKRRGFHEASGDIIITMDGDLQNDPADIPSMISLLDNSDIVCGYRKYRKDALGKIFVSRMANAIRNFLTNDSLRDAGCCLRVMRSSCVHVLEQEKYRLFDQGYFFHPTILKMHGFRVVQMPVSHNPRNLGKSKFKLIRGRLVCGIRACIQMRNMIKKYRRQEDELINSPDAL
jgi:dolichol-phosphate mannosyltransferase